MLYSDPVGDEPGHSGTGDISTEVETDVTASKRRAEVAGCLIPFAGDRGRPSRSGLPVLERSRELLEQTFDSGLAVFQMCCLLVLFPLVARLNNCLF